MRRVVAVCLTLCCLSTVRLRAADLPTVKAGKSAPPKALAGKIAAALAPVSHTVLDGEKTLATFWIRKVIPTKATKTPVRYSTMAVGTLLGVVEIKSEEMVDFRDQELPKGVYTLRVGAHPQDGNHMGIATFPEFLCLSSASDDKSLKPIGHDDLMELSSKALESGHPAVWFLQPFFAKPKIEFPAVNANSLSHIVVNLMTKAKLKDGKEVDTPIGIVIIGISDAA